MFQKLIIRLILVTFFFTSVGPLPDVSAQTIIDLPAPGVMVNKSNLYDPLQLKGILVNVKNPLRFDFLVDKGDSALYGQPLKDEITRLSKYFLTCLTVPEDDLWVNLSPYEKDRIVPGNFGVTLMGKNLLEQDYLLKQIMASLSYPENDLGKRFWQRVYKRSYELYGTTEIPINTFNKVWILPKSAEVYAMGNSAFVVKSQLDVMLEADYKAFTHHSQGLSQNAGAYSQVFRDVILPELRQEVNEGKNFAVVRQVYNAMILATWYKRHLRDSLLGKMYVGRNKVLGVDIADKDAKEKIFNLYLRAYKKCVYNYIKEDYDPTTGQTVPRKYASGGMYFAGGLKSVYMEGPDPKGENWIGPDLAMATVNLLATNTNGDVVSLDSMEASITKTHPFYQVPQENLESSVSQQSRNTLLNSQAMRVSKFLRPLILAGTLAVGGFLMTPTMASAAVPVAEKIGITVNMNTQDAINVFDQQITHYKKEMRRQDGLLNILGTLGDSNETHAILNGLLKEEASARTLLESGKSTLDQQSIISLEVSRITGQLDDTEGQIKERQQKIDTEVSDFNKRLRSFDMHAGERNTRTLNIDYNKNALKELIAKKNQLSEAREADENLERVPVQELIQGVVPNAISSGVLKPSVPLPTPPVVIQTPPLTVQRVPAVTQAPPSVVEPTPSTTQTVPPVVQPASSVTQVAPPAIQPAPSVAHSFNLMNQAPSLGDSNLFSNSQSYQVALPQTNPLSSTINAPPDQLHILGLRISASSNNVASGGVPPPPKDDWDLQILDYVKSSWPECTAIAVLGIGMGLLGRNLLRRSKFVSFKKPVDSKIIPILPSVNDAPANAGNTFDVTLPPPSVSPGEPQILADDLAKLRAVASGAIAPPKPVAVEDDIQSGGKNLWWMHMGALLGGLGLSALLDGGISWMVGVIPFLTGGFYVAQKWLHEKFHLGQAAVLYHPRNLGTTFSPNNLKDHLTFGQWARSLLPEKRTPRAYVDLPFAKAEGGWFNKSRNRIVAGAGFFGSAAVAITAAYFIGLTPLLAPVLFSAAAVLKGSIDSGDLWSSDDTDQGKFGCGIIGFMKRVSLQGVRKKDMKSWLTWFFTGVENSTARGGQQSGVSSNFLGADETFQQEDQKETKEKRNWKLWLTWDKGPVFYRNMINDLHRHFYRALPGRLVPIYNYAKFGVLKFLAHVRFATNGDMVGEAAHPHSSPQEPREQWVWDSVKNMYRKVNRIFNVTSAFNGDHDGTRLGLPYKSRLFGNIMGTGQMRHFFSAAVHKYYQGRITIRYLKRTVSDGLKYKQKVRTDYKAVLLALEKKGYINFWGYVNPRFVKLDDEFKSWFPDYKNEVFAEIESALFGIPPGDAPILPLQQHFDLTIGNWFASMRYAHVMVNHEDLKETNDDILFEKEGRAVGSLFSEVYDQVQPYLARRGFTQKDPDKVRSLSDLYVKDEETAKQLGLKNQYEMIKVFKQMLYKRMELEAGQNTLAGEVFRQWEQGWKAKNENIEEKRRTIIDVAVEKFFTADNIAATKEFAERADGSYGVFMQSPLDDSITLYQDNQDVAIGYNQTAGVIAFGSDPRALKSIGPNGERVEKVMHLKDGEVVNVSFSPSGKVVIRSWMRINGKWTESTKEQLEERVYSTAEFRDDGEKNEYYALPPVIYKNSRRIVQEDLQNIPKILAKAQLELDDPNSFNSQSTDNLVQRISDAIKKHGKARMVLIGYDNSRKISEQFKAITSDLFDKTKVGVDIIDANEFNDSPSKYDIRPDDIVMIVSKSGATFSSKLAMRIIKKLVDRENIFCMTARIDSVLNTMLGQGLRSGKDKFTKRIFITGEFYPSETPVASEVLLEFQMQQLAVNLARSLGKMNDPKITTALKISSDRLEEIAPRITAYSMRLAQELTGFDVNGQEYENMNKEPKVLGRYLGKASLENFYMNWIQRFFVAGVLMTPMLLLGQYIGGGLLGTALNVVWITNVFPFLATELYRKMMGRPAYGRDSPFGLFIAAPSVIASTQRNFFSRILTNRLGSIGPRAIHAGDPTTDFVADHASDQVRGDINIRFALKHRANEGRMGVGQATYPQTAIIGTNMFRGRPEKVDVIIEVPHDEGATNNEISLLDNTVGILGLMIAAKAIGVEMAKVASFDGRLFDLAYTFSSAGVHTTQINPIKEEAREILNSRRQEVPSESVSADPAQTSSRNGGINMSSRLMNLKISGNVENRSGVVGDASISAIQGVIPRVSGIVTVTPDMLKAMLGASYLN
jgi:hypothetical protein